MNLRPVRRAARAGGFTLVEAIVAIVIIGIIGAIVAVFIKAPIQGYTDTVARAEAGEEADLALRRMAREIRLALPNSVRVNDKGTALELLLTKTGGRYLSVEDGATSGKPLDFVDAARREFDVVGGLRSSVEKGEYVVVYNLGASADMAPANAYGLGAADRNIARISKRADEKAVTLELDDNPFARDDPMPSPGRRFQVVSTPVTFACESKNGALVLTRYANYPIRATMDDAMSKPASAVLARRVAACEGIFSYAQSDIELRRSALVLLSLGLHTRSPGSAAEGPVRLVHQVHVDNTP